MAEEAQKHQEDKTETLKKRRKVNELTLEEIQAKLKELEGSKGLGSKYASHLLRRRDSLN